MLTGNGEVLASFCEIPAICRPAAERVMQGLNQAGITGLLCLGDTGKDVCEIPIAPNKVGVVLISGLNPVAAVQEFGIETENHSMCALMEYEDLAKQDAVFSDMFSHR